MITVKSITFNIKEDDMFCIFQLKNEEFPGTEQQNIHNWFQTFYTLVVTVFNMSYTLASMTYIAVYKTSNTEIYFKVRNHTLPKHAEVSLNL